MSSNGSSPNVNGTTSADLFSVLLATFKVSKPVLIVIATFILLGGLIIGLLLIWVIKRCLNKDDGKRKRRKEVDQKDIFGNDAEKYESKYGYIDLSVTYDRRRKKLTIRDMQANNLVCNSQDPPDCFIKMFLRNNKGKPTHLKKTKIKVDNYSPFFSESFSFPAEDVKNMLIYFQIIDDNPNGNDIILGDGVLDMSKLSMDSYIGVIGQTYILLERPLTKEGCGDVCVILSWRDNKQRIVILEAKDLAFKYSRQNNFGTFEHPWVCARVTVYVNKARKKKFVTKKILNTENPYFLETFEATIKRGDLKYTYIKVTLMESLAGKIARKIGSVFIGNPDMNKNINAIGKFHWDLACDAENDPKAMWHSLLTQLKK